MRWNYPVAIWERYKTSIIIAKDTANLFHSFSTLLMSLIIQPIFTIGLLIIIAHSMHEANLHATMVTSCLITLGIGIIQSLIRYIVQEKNSDIYRYDKYLMYHPTYWIGKILMSILPRYLLFTLCTCAIEITIAYNQHNFFRKITHNILLAQQYALPTMLTAIILGIAVAVLAQLFVDPYLLSNIISLTFPITAPVIAPLSSYPHWLQFISTKLPFTQIILAYRDALSNPHSNNFLPYVLWEIITLFTWTILLALFYHSINSYRTQKKPN